MKASLRLVQWLMLLGFASNLIFLSLAIWSYDQRRENQIATIAEVSEATARLIRLKLSSLAKEARVLAAELAIAGNDLKRIEEMLRAAAATTDHHYVLGDQRTTQLINTSAPQGLERATPPERRDLRALFSDKDILLTAPKESQFIGTKQDGVFRGERFYGIRVPIRVAGEIRYVLTLLARPSALHEILLQAYRPPGWGASVIDQKGRIVARSHGHELLAGRMAPPEVLDRSARAPRGVVETVTLEGTPSTSSLLFVPGTDWRVGVWAPHDVLFEPIWLIFTGIALANLLICAGLMIALRSRGGPINGLRR